MSKGKFAAQAAHAAMLALELSPSGDRLTHIWRHAGGHYAKVVLACDDLLTTREYIEARFPGHTALVIDEGRTEFGAKLTPTFLGVRVLDKNRADVAATFGEFNLYPDTPKMAIIEVNQRLTPEQLKELREKIQAGMPPHEVRRMLPTTEEEKRSFIQIAKEQLRAHRPRRGP
jgi:peptidyl-tRNA hydrolase